MSTAVATNAVELPCAKNWNALTANLIFERHMQINDFDEEAAYAVLVAMGCPELMADAAWNQWANRGDA